MSRRSHVVRTEDQGARGLARSLGGANVFCSYEDCGSISQGDSIQIAHLPITSTRSYQRCFLYATVGRINAEIEEPPPLGTYTLTFETPLGAGEGAWSPWLEVPAAPAQIESMEWEGLVSGSQIQVHVDEAGYQPHWITAPPASDNEWMEINLAGPTRIRLRVFTGTFAPESRVTVTMRGDGDDQVTPPDEQWEGPPTHFAYTLETTMHRFEALEARPGYIISWYSTNKRAEVTVPDYGLLEKVEIISDIATNWYGVGRLRAGPASDGDMAPPVTPSSAGVIWTATFDPPKNVTTTWLRADIAEHQESLNAEGTQDALLAVKWYIIDATDPCPDDWPGRPGHEVPFEDFPLA